MCATREPEKLCLGGVTITWDPAFRFPIGVHEDWTGYFVTLCDVTYTYGRHSLVVPAGFAFDGASIPWLIRIVPGFSNHDWHLLAALVHDFICDHPEELPRPVGDGIFVSVMLELAAHRVKSSVSRRQWISRTLQAWLMYVSVAGFTFYRALSGATIQT
jgi:hypothetical protein